MVNSEEEIDCQDGFDCGGCNRPNSVERRMVSCDNCLGWWHLSCANQSPGVKDRPWRCTKCTPPSADPSESVNTADFSTPIVRSKAPHSSSTRIGRAEVENGARKKCAESNKDSSVRSAGKSVRSTTSSARIRTELELAKLVAEREIKSRRMREEMRFLEKERAIRLEELASEESFLKKKHQLEEKLVEDSGSESVSESAPSGSQKAEEWLRNQLEENNNDPEEVFDVSNAEARSGKILHAMVERGEEHHANSRIVELSTSKSVHSEPRSHSARIRVPIMNLIPEVPPPKQPINPFPQPVAFANLNIGPSAEQVLARQVWPRKLPVFAGEPEEWPIFFHSYETSNAACGFSDVENLVRLRESLRGAAREAVRTKLTFPDSVPKIMETLKRFYGRPEILVRNMLAKVRKLESPKSERLDSLIKFATAVQHLCDQLEAAGLRAHLSNPDLLSELVEKLPAHHQLAWVRYKRSFPEPTLKEFGQYMEELAEDACEVTTLVPPKPETAKYAKPSQKKEGHFHAHINSDGNQEEYRQRKPCPICGGLDHRVRNCSKFQELNLDSRKRAVRQWNLCEMCLNEHGNWKCKSRIRCNIEGCRVQHHPLLHVPAQAKKGEATVVKSVCNSHNEFRKAFFFRIVPLTLHNGNRTVDTFGFYDEGSSLTIMESSLARRLGIEGKRHPLELQWTSGVTRNENSSKLIKCKISKLGDPKQHSFTAHTVSKLKLPKQTLCYDELANRYEHLKDTPISSFNDAQPEVLIGLDNIDILTPIESRQGQPGEPVAVRSLLGWAIYGPNEAGDRNDKNSVRVNFHHCDADQELNNLIRQHFVLEEPQNPFAPILESAEDKRCKTILEETTVFRDGAYETGLLWKADEVSFPDNRYMAERRLKCLESKLSKDPELQANVHQQIRDYLTKGYAHKATEEELAGTSAERVWYLPLNVVSHPKKPNKRRLVWDAAASVGGVSLNNQLLKGPDLLVPLHSVICKFREWRIGFGGDVKEMFHQIRIRAADKNYQRFLFRFDATQPPDVYIMDVATFGATCSPCSAIYVLHKIADECREDFPKATTAIKEKTYMDDYFDSAPTSEEAADRAIQVKGALARAGFTMRNWVSNDESVLQAVGENSEQKSLSLISNMGSDNIERVLGLEWNPRQDCFQFPTSLRGELAPYVCGERRPTKRMALRCIMSLFDPLGLLSPYTIHGKMLFQDLWRCGIQWDDDIPDEAFEKWVRWTKLLQEINNLQIPRCYCGGDHAGGYETLQLHVFTDASELGYGCAAYFRVIEDGKVKCCLVMAKAKVASLKVQSIPRRELQAAVLGARMMINICSSHTVEIKEKFLWTDSTTVLSWIRSDHRKFKQYVAVRIGEILTLTDSDQWRWVPSKENIADCLTKWNKDTDPKPDGRWFNGPSFLYEPVDRWPQQKSPNESTNEELRTHYLFHHIDIPIQLIDIARISKWTILVRILATVIRFISNCRRRKKALPIETVPSVENVKRYVMRTIPNIETPLKQSEYQSAENILWRLAQSEHYPDEVKVLISNRERALKDLIKIEKSSSLYQLSPFADEFGVIRVEGRTVNAQYASFDSRFPVILPREHLVTQRLLEHYHRIFGHANRETIVNELRQRFQIANLRSAVNEVSKSCQVCKIKKCKPHPPRMAPLPEQRLTPYTRPFAYTGVDYLGPLEVTVGRRKEKRYVAVFTCLVVRAVHLELAYSLTTDSCIMAIRRFVRRRGPPRQIFSDNGTNFVGADRELKRQIKRINVDCSDTFTNARTSWLFNPPSAPHMGGVWERMVRSVKESMRALDDGRKLNDEILLTVLAETEAFINSRPLTYMPQSSADYEALTPNHFLGNSTGDQDPMRDPISLSQALQSSYLRSQYLADATWDRWLKEYFPNMNKRSKLCRRTWIRGRIVELIPNKDGRIRRVAVQTASGRLERPVAKLAVMEIGNGESEQGDAEADPDSRGGECSGIPDVAASEQT
ncbi:uncharacterized protein LOC129741947 [Uranotaenia lowii]|uniref:uncharacterized protein LOC129741947 n=1 Tax=Uranotaenia lowii TaxID=190385 RepID=UPI002479F737|nr:uncharacterized protein LOC129741947 [Uranotaenia lowii]